MVTLPAFCQEFDPSWCPDCGSPHVGSVRNEDVEPVVPSEQAARAYPGVLECRNCGVIQQWEG